MKKTFYRKKRELAGDSVETMERRKDRKAQSRERYVVSGSPIPITPPTTLFMLFFMFFRMFFQMFCICIKSVMTHHTLLNLILNKFYANTLDWS